MTYVFSIQRIAPLIVAACFAIPAGAADESEVKQVYEHVRAQFSDFVTYCGKSDAERRQTVVKSAIALASARKLTDPVGAGTEAGALLRKECGIDAAALTPAQIRWMVVAKPLSFDGERRHIGTFTSAQALANRVYTPAGDGPFSAVVVNQTKSISNHLLVQAKALVEAGFAVLVVDTFGPRDYKAGVSEPLPAEFAKDAYDALAHLRTLPYIDKERIYQTGFSFGGMAAALLASPEGADALKAVGRFRATVGHYGSCRMASPYAGGKTNATYLDMLSADSDRPLLMLMAELDIETPPSNCFPLLDEMKAAGKPVEWHIYPNTTHAWDKAEHNGFVYRTTSGETMTYRYDAAITQDATRRMIGFFNRYR